jgi:hypothetical protein
MGNAYGPLSTEISQIIESEVLSSDDEAQRVRKSNKTPRLRRRPRKPLKPITSADGKSVLVRPRQESMDISQDEQLLPKDIVPFASMMTEASWLCTDPSKDGKCKGPSAKSAKAKQEKEMAKCKEDPLAQPEFDPIFNGWLEKLGQPNLLAYVAGRNATKEEALKSLKDGTISLHTVSSDTESALLGEAGTFKMKELQNAERSFVPCLNDQGGCFQYEKYKRVGRSWMTDDEYRKFMQDNVLPARRICILCHRYIMTGIFSSMQAEGETITVDDTKTLLQQFCNKHECVGGYKRQFTMFSPAGRKIRGLWGTFVRFEPDYLREYIDENGAWRLDQSILCWRPQQVISPEIGETNQDFH